jgi:outer membrane murein-binding lipoprotein Lpp
VSNNSRTIQVNTPLAIILVVGVLIIASIGWSLSLRSELDEADSRVAELEAEVDLLRQQANATAYVLAPSPDAPANSHGTAFFSLNGTGVITVANLDPLAEGRMYQAWYYPTSDAEPYPGATFAVDANGTGFMLIPADVGMFTDVTITLEPETGSTLPTGPVILTGSTGGARG